MPKIVCVGCGKPCRMTEKWDYVESYPVHDQCKTVAQSMVEEDSAAGIIHDNEYIPYPKAA